MERNKEKGIFYKYNYDGFELIQTDKGVKKLITELSTEKTKKMLKNFYFPARYIESVIDLKLTENQREIASRIKKWILDKKVDSYSLYLYGNAGVGKTTLLTRLTFFLLKKMIIKKTFYLSFAKLLGKDLQTLDKVLFYLLRCPCRYFIVDDIYIPFAGLGEFQIQKMSNFFYEVYNIINSKKLVIFVGNITPERILELPPHPLNDRIQELLLSNPIELKEKNFRKEKIREVKY